MYIYVPMWLLPLLLAYMALGLILYVPMCYWGASYISPRRRHPWVGMSVASVLVSLVVGGMLLWPWVVVDILRMRPKNK